MRLGPWMLAGASMACTVFVAVWHMSTVTTHDRALEEALAAEIYDSRTAPVGNVIVTCNVYTNDPPAVEGGGTPKAGGWFVQACTAKAKPAE